MKLIIFDKDGVLLDLTKTWLPVALDITYLMAELTKGKYEPQLFQSIIGISEATKKIDPDGLFASGSFIDQQIACIAKAPELEAHFQDPSYREKVLAIVAKNAERGPAPLGDIEPALISLRNEGYQLAILTNDAEHSAKDAMRRLELTSYFELILGFDSGYGGKPAPSGFQAICEHCKVTPDEAIMIGDTGADVNVAKAAGAGVFVGISQLFPQPTKVLQGSPLLLPNIEGLPELLAKNIRKSA